MKSKAKWNVGFYEKEDIKIHEEIVNKNTLGIKLKGKTVKELRVGNFDAVVPHISGETFITGFNQLILGKEDSLKYGWYRFKNLKVVGINHRKKLKR